MPENNKGFTLVELMIAMAAAMIASVVFFAYFSSTSKVFTTQNVAAEVQQTLRAAVHFVSWDIRMAGFSPSGGDFGIETATPTQIILTYDKEDSPNVYGGTVEEDDAERIEYSLDSGELQQRIGAGPTTSGMTDNVSNLTFSYLDEDNAAISAGTLATKAGLDSIRTVQIQLTVQEPAGRDKPVERTIETSIACRNLGL
jgi:prepilin-type N-terminal cleavage/methylation domain-containing protein